MIPSGQKVGPYEVVSLIGAGGMGEVYRARDPRLGRDVALKIVRSSGEPHPRRFEQFEREARAVAALSHPNVLTVFDVGRSGGDPYLVFELLEGETVRERLRRGCLPMRRGVEVAMDVCRGLEAAHRRGLVHRDLTPRNLFLTREGGVKILDFGLAKLRRSEHVRHPGEGEAAETAQAGEEDLRRAPPDKDENTPTTAGVMLGTLGYISPEQAQGRSADARADIFALGAILYEMLSGRKAFSGRNRDDVLFAMLHRDPPALSGGAKPLPRAVDQIVRRCLAKEPSERFHSAHDLFLALEALLDFRDSGQPLAEAAEARNPYPGLASFTEEDAARFFGRESEVEAVWRHLKVRYFIGVIGPSGAGKTSFVRAGVVASRPAGWAAVVMTPGTSPLRMLCQALAPELKNNRHVLRQAVRFEDPEAAYELVAGWRASHPHALLVVDQFEELFTLNLPEVQERFTGLLGRLSGEAGLRVLLSIRDDFLMRCQAHAALAPVFSELTPLGPLTGTSLRRALREPAKSAGLRFQDGLLDRILVEVEGERGALPLLAFAVSRLWENRDSEQQLLTHRAWEAIGGVAGALARHAEVTLEQIGPERPRILRELFRNLVTSQGTRAVVNREELLSVFPDREVASAVVDRLIQARLLTSYEAPMAEDAGEDGPEGRSRHRIEIVHESLLTSWQPLVRWRAQDSAGALLRDQLKQAARLWEDKGRPEDLLWTGTSYLEYRAWHAGYPGRLSALEESFVAAMTALAGRRLRRRRLLTAVALAASLTATVVVGVLLRQEADAHRRAEASRLTALGRLELEVEPTAALAHARASLALHDTTEARRLALEALWRGPVARVLSVPPAIDCTTLAAAADGRWLACGNWGGPHRPRAEAEKGRALPTENRSVARLGPLAPSDDGQRLLSGGPGEPSAVLWSAEGRSMAGRGAGRPPSLLEGDSVLVTWTRAGGWQLQESGVSDSGLTVSWPERDGIYQDVDASRGRLLFSRGRSLFLRPLGQSLPRARDVLVGRHPSPVRYAGFHESAEALVSVDENREIRIWSNRSPELQHAREGLDAQIFSFPSLDSTGTRLAWHSLSERATVLWDLAGPPDAGPLLMRRRNVAGDVGSTVFLGDGRWLASAAAGAVALWPVELPWPRVLRGHTSAILEVAFTPSSAHLVSCGGDGARVWPLAPGTGRQRPIEYDRSYACNSVSIDPAGGHVLVAAPAEAGLLAPLEGGAAEVLVRVPPSESIRATALDPGGRWAAVAAVYAPDAADRRLHLVDRRTRQIHSFPLPGADDASPDSGGVYALRFVGDGRLLSVGDAGLLSWEPQTGEFHALYPSGCGTLDASQDGNRVVVGCLTPGTAEAGRGRRRSSEVFVLDVQTGVQRPVRTHGDAVQAVAIDPSGELIATGDTTGVVRVGRADGSEPHLFLGARGTVTSVDFSPDRRWVAGAVGRELWLWPLPDVSKTALHTAPLEVLTATIDSLTNLRLVADPAEPTGYRVEMDPSPGWSDSPTW